MKKALITGSCGLIGSEAVRFFIDNGFEVIGVDDDSRSTYFGSDASTHNTWLELIKDKRYTHYGINIKNYELICTLPKDVDIIIHTAAQPSHDWAATNPFEDFEVNARGTLNMLEFCRNYCPEAVFINMSTNKVYGDRPNTFIMYESMTRWNAMAPVTEYMRIDESKHSLFGCSKLYGDIITQEYGRYFGMKTVSFRGGCLTGSNHAGVKAHGFLSYLVRCVMTGTKYYINGYGGKQVRDNIHAYDVVTAMWEYYQDPKKCGVVYNIGGGDKSNCSILEAIQMIEEISGKKLEYEILDKEREGDHQWYITDMSKFKKDYPNWQQKYDLKMIIEEMVKSYD